MTPCCPWLLELLNTRYFIPRASYASPSQARQHFVTYRSPAREPILKTSKNMKNDLEATFNDFHGRGQHPSLFNQVGTTYISLLAGHAYMCRNSDANWSSISHFTGKTQQNQYRLKPQSQVNLETISYCELASQTMFLARF